MKTILNKDDFIKIGSLKKKHKTSGELVIHLLPNFYDIIMKPTWLFIDIENGLVPFEVLDHKMIKHDSLVVRLDISNEIEQTFKNVLVYINSDEIIKSEKNKNQWKNDDLIGFSVTDKNHGYIGIIRDIIEIQQNPLIEIIYNEQEILVPYQEDFIVSIDKTKRELNIAAPEGLIELFVEN